MPERGEVWQVDFGMAQKVRPALVISIPYSDADRALIGVIPHTTAVRGSQFEVSVPVRFLQEGAFLFRVSLPFRQGFSFGGWESFRPSKCAASNWFYGGGLVLTHNRRMPKHAL